MTEARENPFEIEAVFDGAKKHLQENPKILAQTAIFRALHEQGVTHPAKQAEYMGILLKRIGAERQKISHEKRANRAWSQTLAEKAQRDPLRPSRTYEESDEAQKETKEDN